MQGTEAGVFLSTTTIAFLVPIAGILGAVIVKIYYGYIGSLEKQAADWKALFLSEQEINIGKDVVIAQALASGSRALDLARSNAP